MMMIELNDDVAKRLKALAVKTGRTDTEITREAIEAYLEDLEEFYVSEERMRRFDGRVIKLADVKAELGL